MTWKTWFWLGVGAVVIGFWVAGRNGAVVDGASPPAAAAPRQPGEGDIAQFAKALCRRAVPQALNDPASVEFVDQDGWTVTIGADHRHVVRMSLRAKNAFDATILLVMDCEVEDRGTEWEALRVTQVSP